MPPRTRDGEAGRGTRWSACFCRPVGTPLPRQSALAVRGATHRLPPARPLRPVGAPEYRRDFPVPSRSSGPEICSTRARSRQAGPHSPERLTGDPCRAQAGTRPDRARQAGAQTRSATATARATGVVEGGLAWPPTATKRGIRWRTRASADQAPPRRVPDARETARGRKIRLRVGATAPIFGRPHARASSPDRDNGTDSLCRKRPRPR
jgi:hypothetical protein